jgi:hypothetical protein
MKLFLFSLGVIVIGLFYIHNLQPNFDEPEQVAIVAEPRAVPVIQEEHLLVSTKETPSSMPSVATQTDPIEHFCSHLQIGGSYTRVKITPKDSPFFNGNLGGAQALYEFRSASKIYGGLKLAWRQGLTKNHTGTRFLLDATAEERLGYTFGDQTEKNLFSLYTGFGFRYLGHNFKPETGSSMKFRYQEYYVPVGFLYDHEFNRNFALGLYFTWMPQVYPSVRIVPLREARWILTDKLANFLVEAPFTFYLTRSKRVSLILKPFFEYWKDGRSTAITETMTTLDIPGNTYLFGGVNLNLAFSF